MSNLYNNIKNLRLKLGMSQEELAQKTGYKSRTSIAKIEKGIVDLPQSKIPLFAKALNTTSTDLVGNTSSIEKDFDTTYLEDVNNTSIAFEITARSLQYSPTIYASLLKWIKQYSSTTFISNSKEHISSAKTIYEILKSPTTSYEEKAFMLNEIIDFVLYDWKKGKIQIYLDTNGHSSDSSIHHLSHLFSQLNETGLKKIMDYGADLSSVPMYQKNYSDTVLNAAHARTDVVSPEGTDTSDDDIMDDDNF